MINIYKALDEIRTKTGIEYSIGYYCVNSTDLSDVLQDVGAVATWAPQYSKITEVRINRIVGLQSFPCYVDLFAEPRDATNTQDNDTFSTKEVSRVTLAEFRFDKDHFGVREAKSEEAGKWYGVNGSLCNIGELVFKNTNSNGTGGHADYSQAPFTASFSGTQIMQCLSGMPYNCQVYTVTFYTKSTPLSMAGKAPKKPAGTGWRLENQNIEEVYDNKGNKWTRVEQSFKKVPVVGMAWKDALV